MPVLITNDFGADNFTETLLERDATALLTQADKSLFEMSILLTTDSAIQEINKTWRRKDTPTNVLSFPMDDDDDSICPMLGDIIISIDTAQREALAKHCSLQTYLTRLLVHGFVHLLGYDHEESVAAYDKMNALEKEYLQKLGEL